MNGTVVSLRGDGSPVFSLHGMSNRPPAIPFREPERARLNWVHIERTAPREILGALASLLKSSPDPDSALNYFERFNANASPRTIQFLTRNLGALNVLIPIFSQSHFLSETLGLHPEWIEALYRDKRIEFVKSKEDLLEELSRFETSWEDRSLSERLALFKRREYLRIAYRDVARIATLAETTEELSTLAEVILEKAYRLCDQQLRNRFGAPRSVDDSGRIIPAEFVVIALGKLGGKELNYSSDIDLLYLYTSDGETEGSDARAECKISNQEYFIKLSSAITEAVSRVTPVGWAFRVDLRLRPQGREGFLTRSLPSAVEYYRRHAEPWELQALVKARPVAGQLILGKELIRSLQACIFPTEDRKKIIESVERMRSKLDEKLIHVDAAGFNVKLERGTIRDIEFVTQCLQRFYGAEDSWVREGNTLQALSRLHDNNYINRKDFVELASAYRFFRIIEHHLQLDRGQQTHTVPASEDEQQLLALRLGFEDAKQTSARDALLHAIEYHRGNVLRIYSHVIEQQLEIGSNPPALTTQSFERDAERNDQTWTRSFSELEKLNPAFSRVAQEARISKTGEKLFHAFLEVVFNRRILGADDEIRKDAGSRLEAIFNSGNLLGETSVRHPEWVIPQLVKPPKSQRSPVRKKGGIRASSVGSKKPGRGTSSESQDINRLRDETRRRIFDVLTEDAVSRPPLGKTFPRLSLIADEAVNGAMEISKRIVFRKLSSAGRKILADPKFRFGVLSLGRLATQELDVGSDLDLIFVSDYSFLRDRDAVRQIAYALAENFVSILTSYTREGPLYVFDPRLRPSGREGELVQDADHFVEYVRNQAQAWELVAYLKLRPSAGDRRWAAHECRKILESCIRRAAEPTLKSDLLDFRSRVEQESATAQDSIDLAKAPGGVYDIDYTLGYSHLSRGKGYRVGSTLGDLIQHAAKDGLLSASIAGELRAALSLYREVDHALRMFHGISRKSVDRKSLSELPREMMERVDAAAPPGQKSVADSNRVFDLLLRTARSVRESMEQVFSDLS